MALPQLTPEARTEALNKAMAVRRQRSEVLGTLKSGEVSLKEVLERTDDVVGKTPVRRLLEALPGIGKVRADQLMTGVGISESRRVQGLGPRQRERLLELLQAQD
ncbi:integration host factor, actinobacterial type [Kitasatospora aureofaciens]|uniref:integration host factor, actinobacterial type n=1 Tax=Kitasatospora aureofaciens TaxID=1894 RepID=UPI0005257132|nr:integration host factor, actinobacterial type [Kitasatospora aureofaciens]